MRRHYRRVVVLKDQIVLPTVEQNLFTKAVGFHRIGLHDISLNELIIDAESIVHLYKPSYKTGIFSAITPHVLAKNV